MSTTETTTTVTEAAPKAVKKAVKRSAKRDNGEVTAKTLGITKLQARTLQALARAEGPLTRPKLYAALGFKNNSGLNDVLGKNDPKKRAAADKAKYPCLITLGHVRVKELDVDGAKENVYEIMASGRKIVEKL